MRGAFGGTWYKKGLKVSSVLRFETEQVTSNLQKGMRNKGF